MNQEDNLFDLKEKMQNVEGFFRNQVGIFDAAVKLESDLRSDKDYIAEMPEINDALNKNPADCHGGGRICLQQNSHIERSDDNHQRRT
ncbi:MAG: hypothetical protein IJM51_07320 [Clostridia bacterium]|nr:hypothetical protein [Clostridia bacterium]